MDLRRSGLRRSRLFVLVAVFLLSLGRAATPAPAEAATALYPDLRMARLSDFRIVRTTDGRRLLRFSATMLNLGRGPLEVRANRSSTSSPWDVDQVVYDDAGGQARRNTSATMRYGGDGHDHWHVNRMVDSDLWSPRVNGRGAKIGFCFFDTTAWDLDLPRSPNSPVYRESTCADRNDLSSRMGISVGWGDRYQWSLPFQWVDITGLPGGDYILRSMVDAPNYFGETSNSNNCTYTRLRFSTSSSAVTVLGSGVTCPNDWSGTTFANDIAWATRTGVANFCAVDLFCPPTKVTRAHVASFIARALDLPATSRDFFRDDDHSSNEPDINRLAAAGITSGCGSGRYCPDRLISRGEVMAFVARGLKLPSTTRDFFTDDGSSPHHASINRAAAAGIAAGCAPNRFCPFAAVTRGQMAAFTHRAVGD